MTDAADRVLEVLMLGWDDFYEIGIGLDGYWARRRDGLGGTMIDADPEGLRRQVQEDYAGMPRRA